MTPLLHVADRTGTGPPLVLLHGLASPRIVFDRLVRLLEGDHDVIRMDLLGFGGSPTPTDCRYTLQEHGDAVAATMRRLHLDAPVLVGYSLGALVAARVAADDPTIATSVCLVAPPIIVPADVLASRWQRARERLLLQGAE
ncbi:pimeloyl-ACP methyl ester carboxylesterase [Clavibacter michiganensis]|uniref:alpha/beta fold hydrolase n=1 Tax=Clavibacter michiganensis TaxID=28447 RepID=UPI001AE0FEA9|nr:alpha/beta fold hydrolase [Clavibacter michiganensis]MBP2458389.1 pimeloyl-ACP methyl ester carboxylesterase [Clavibacter michiganensis]MDQ0410960.1 pimeloyl-ACP methyl ester carboxylesterase [Clavibacter michiganensis]